MGLVVISSLNMFHLAKHSVVFPALRCSRKYRLSFVCSYEYIKTQNYNSKKCLMHFQFDVDGVALICLRHVILFLSI